jgi:hypothetical protein
VSQLRGAAEAAGFSERDKIFQPFGFHERIMRLEAARAADATPPTPAISECLFTHLFIAARARQ